MKKLFLTILAGAVLCATTAFSQTMPSLLLPSDAAAWGRAGASLAAPVDGYAAENNAAAMSMYDGKIAAGASFNMLQPKAGSQNMLSLGAFGKFGSKLAVGLFGKMLMYPEYQIYSSNGVPQQVNGTYSPSEMAFGLAASYNIVGGLSVGLTGKFASSSLATDAKASTFAGDASLLYGAENWRAAVAVCNIGGKVKYCEEGS